MNELVHKECAFIDKLTAEVGKVIVGQKRHDRAHADRPAHRRPRAARGRARPRQDADGARRCADSARREVLSASSSRPTCCPPTSSAPSSTTSRRGEFTPKQGPIFANLVLADEINRAPAKVQRALLEAMQERQVTIGDTTYPLPEPFLVWRRRTRSSRRAPTRCPRRRSTASCCKVKVGYPTREEEREIMDRMTGADDAERRARSSTPRADRARRAASSARSTSTRRSSDYIVDIVLATREPQGARPRASWPTSSQYGATPRASIASTWRRARTRSCATAATSRPRTSRRSASTCCATASILTYEAEAEEITPRTSCARIFEHVEVP